jgi:hypothetical protein
MKKLPIGVSNIREIVDEGYAYVDKSEFVYQLVESGKYYFLSRPRRFGKSLFIDTLKEAFEGNRDLFRGLWLHDHWDWEKKHPVIQISFGGGVVRNRKELDRRIVDILYRNQKSLGITCRDPEDVPGCFGELIRNSAEKFGLRTVVLVDEYDKPLDDIRGWYNGYGWLGEKVYNPFSILNYLRFGEFRNYWFESGTPSFLVELFKKKRYYIPAIENMEASESIIGAFDVDFVEPENLLFQTGYLTVAHEFRVAGKMFYKLRYPNMEVKSSLSDYILKRYSPDPVLKDKTQLRLYQALEKNDLDALDRSFRTLFAAIPHDWYRKNKLADYEGYYASVFYCYFKALGLDVTAEDTTNHGRIDMTVRLENRVFIFEFKVKDIDKTPGTALEQIHKKGYADKYRAQNFEIYLIGVEFDRNERNIVRFEWESQQFIP